MLNRDTRWLLEQWVLWELSDSGLHQSNPLAYLIEQAQAYRETRCRESCQLTDDEALSIGKIVSRLNHRNKETGQALMIFYFSKCNMSYAAKKLKIRRDKAEVLVRCGESWVDAAIHAGAAA